MPVSVDMLGPKLAAVRFEYAEQDLRAAAHLAVRIADVGRRADGATIPYGVLVQGIRFQLDAVHGGRPFEIDTRLDLHRRIIGDFLGFVSARSYAEAGFLASALVVDRVEMRPSARFFQWMRELGAIPDLGEDAILTFWLAQLRAAHAWYAEHGGDPVPGIESSPDVCGGEPRIAGTRVPVWLLEQARRLGQGQAQLLAAYPTLRPLDAYHAGAYAAIHADEIEREIRDNEAA